MFFVWFYHCKIFFHLIVIVALYMMDLIVCICLYLFVCVFFSRRARHPIKYNIHSLHYCLHSTRVFVCVCFLYFYHLMFQTKTNWFSDRLLQFTDKRFNFSLMFLSAVCCSTCVCVCWVHNTVMTSKFTLYFPNFSCAYFLNHSKINTHSHIYIRKCISMQSYYISSFGFFVVVVSVDSAQTKKLCFFLFCIQYFNAIEFLLVAF